MSKFSFFLALIALSFASCQGKVHHRKINSQDSILYVAAFRLIKSDTIHRKPKDSIRKDTSYSYLIDTGIRQHVAGYQTDSDDNKVWVDTMVTYVRQRQARKTTRGDTAYTLEWLPANPSQIQRIILPMAPFHQH